MSGPPGPPRTGYAFDGRVRSTAVQSPGGYEIVMFVGATAHRPARCR